MLVLHIHKEYQLNFQVNWTKRYTMEKAVRNMKYCMALEAKKHVQ